MSNVKFLSFEFTPEVNEVCSGPRPVRHPSFMKICSVVLSAASQAAGLVSPLIQETSSVLTNWRGDAGSAKTETSPAAYDIALRITMTWMTENLHHHHHHHHLFSFRVSSVCVILLTNQRSNKHINTGDGSHP